MEPGDLFFGAGRDSCQAGALAMTVGAGAGASMVSNGGEVDVDVGVDVDVVKAAGARDFDFVQEDGMPVRAEICLRLDFKNVTEDKRHEWGTRICMCMYVCVA